MIIYNTKSKYKNFLYLLGTEIEVIDIDNSVSLKIPYEIDTRTALAYGVSYVEIQAGTKREIARNKINHNNAFQVEDLVKKGRYYQKLNGSDDNKNNFELVHFHKSDFTANISNSETTTSKKISSKRKKVKSKATKKKKFESRNIRSRNIDGDTLDKTQDRDNFDDFAGSTESIEKLSLNMNESITALYDEDSEINIDKLRSGFKIKRQRLIKRKNSTLTQRDFYKYRTKKLLNESQNSNVKDISNIVDKNTKEAIVEVETKWAKIVPIITLTKEKFLKLNSNAVIKLVAKNSRGKIIKILNYDLNIQNLILDWSKESVQIKNTNNNIVISETKTGKSRKQARKDLITKDDETFGARNKIKNTRERKRNSKKGTRDDKSKMGQRDGEEVFSIFRKKITNSLETEPKWERIGNKSKSEVSSFITKVKRKIENSSPAKLRVISTSDPNKSADLIVGRKGKNPTSTNNFVKMSNESNNIVESFFARNNDQGIEIVISNTRPNTFISIHRKNLSSKEREFSIVDFEKYDSFIVPEQIGEEIKIIDTDVKIDRVYQYKVCVNTKEIEPRFLNKIETIKRSKTGQGKYQLKIDKIETVLENNKKFNVTFELSAKATEGRLIGLNQISKNKNFNEVILNTIQEEQENIDSIFAFHVERIDLKSGIKEDAGVVSVEKYSDFDFQDIKNLSELKKGRTYRYNVTLLTREPLTLLKNYTQQSTDFRTQKAYSYSPFKFRDPKVLATSTLKKTANVSESIVETLDEEFLKGVTTLSKEFDVTIPDSLPSIVNIKTGIKKNKMGIVSWSISSGEDKIDHFIILGRTKGKLSIIGYTPMIINKENYEFIDLKHLKESKKIHYFIKPVFNDGTIGDKIDAGEVSAKVNTRNKVRNVKTGFGFKDN